MFQFNHQPKYFYFPLFDFCKPHFFRHDAMQLNDVNLCQLTGAVMTYTHHYPAYCMLQSSIFQTQPFLMIYNVITGFNWF